MEILETKYGDRTGISCIITGLLTIHDIIKYFDLLRNENIFSVTPHFNKHDIDLMESKIPLRIQLCCISSAGI
jgi:hypothetical protein